jgi:hypothetical protein
MLSNMDMHKNFYIRGVVNSLLPEFMNPLDKEITENNISGEAIELLRSIVQQRYPDMEEGEVNMLSGYGGDQEVELSLGQFGVTKENGQYVIFDTYDFESVDQSYLDSIKESLGTKNILPFVSKLGGQLMPENPDGSSREDALKVRIRIPDEPQVVDMDFDNDIEPTASTFVFEGPMTNKRKKLWDTFTSMFVTPAEAGQLDRLVPLGLTGKQTRDFYENYAKELTRDGAVPAMGSAQVPLSPDTDTSFLDN